MAIRRRLAVVVVAALAGAVLQLAAPPGAVAAGCPTAVDAGRFASARELRDGTKVMADLGPRPTGSASHERFLQYLEQRVDDIDGLRRTAITDTIQRQLETSASLRLTGPTGEVPVPVA